MPSTAPLRRLAAGAAVALLAACSKDATGPALVPAALAIYTGNNQIGALSGILNLSVRVLAADSQPVTGVSVSWAVVEGTATVAPASGATVGGGIAATVVTLGAVTGPVTVEASVAALAPVTFTLFAGDPCSVFNPISLAQPVDGDLVPVDCAFFDGSRIDYYRLDLAAATGLQIDMSADFDTYLFLYDSLGRYVGEDDDIVSGVNTDSRLIALVPAGSYFIAANAFAAGLLGPYTLTVTDRGFAAPTCEVMWVMRSVSATHTIPTTTCTWGDPIASGPSNLMLAAVDAGQTVNVTVSSSAFLPTVTLLDGFGNVLTSATQSGAQPVTVQFTAAVDDVVLILITPSDAITGQAYQVSVF